MNSKCPTVCLLDLKIQLFVDLCTIVLVGRSFHVPSLLVCSLDKVRRLHKMWSHHVPQHLDFVQKLLHMSMKRKILKLRKEDTLIIYAYHIYITMQLSKNWNAFSLSNPDQSLSIKEIHAAE